jgi:hypothetical protein
MGAQKCDNGDGSIVCCSNNNTSDDKDANNEDVVCSITGRSLGNPKGSGCQNAAQKAIGGPSAKPTSVSWTTVRGPQSTQRTTVRNISVNFYQHYSITTAITTTIANTHPPTGQVSAHQGTAGIGGQSGRQKGP